VGEAVRAGAGIIIVGGAITKSEDAGVAARVIKEAMESGTSRESVLYKRYTDPVKAFLWFQLLI